MTSPVECDIAPQRDAKPSYALAVGVEPKTASRYTKKNTISNS